MNVVQKLDIFSKSAINEAMRAGAGIRQELDGKFEEECLRIRHEAMNGAAAEIEALERDLKRERDRALTKAKTDYKRRALELRERLTESLFADVRKALENYAANDEAYFSGLKAGILAFCEKYGDAVAYTAERDAARLKEEPEPLLKAVLDGGTGMIGGFRAVSKAGGVAVNESYSELLREARAEFNAVKI